MTYLAFRLVSATSNMTRSTIEYAAQTACSLLVTASRAGDYVQSIVPAYCQEVWVIGQGALITACGIATMLKASRATGSRKWRVLAAAGGMCAIGVGISAALEGIGRLCAGSAPMSLQQRQMRQMDIQVSHYKQLKEPVCLHRETPNPFEQTCDSLNHKSVHVMCHVADGKGDVVHCKRLYEFLESSFHEHRITIGMPKDVEPYIERYFPSAFCKQVNWVSSYTELASLKSDLIVDCPVIVDEGQFFDVINTISGGTTPHVGITEFDFTLTDELGKIIRKRNHTQSTFLTAGLQNSSIGLPFDTAHYKASLRTGTSELDRLKHLRDLNSKALQEAILGQPYSQSAVEAFHKKFSLYPSYTKHSISKDAFFSTILRTLRELNETRDPCFVFVGRPPFEASSGIPVGETITFSNARELGFSHIDFLQSVQNISEFRFKQLSLDTGSEPVRAVRIVSVPYTQNQNLLALSSAGRIGQATGDLSAVEMLETHTPFLYEQLFHKEEFAEALLKHAAGIDRTLGQKMRDLMIVFDGERPLFRDFDGNIEAHIKYKRMEVTWENSSIEKAASALKYVLKHPKKWERFIKHLVDHHNSFKRIHEVVRHHLD